MLLVGVLYHTSIKYSPPFPFQIKQMPKFKVGNQNNELEAYKCLGLRL